MQLLPLVLAVGAGVLAMDGSAARLLRIEVVPEDALTEVLSSPVVFSVMNTAVLSGANMAAWVTELLGGQLEGSNVSFEATGLREVSRGRLEEACYEGAYRRQAGLRVMASGTVLTDGRLHVRMRLGTGLPQDDALATAYTASLAQRERDAVLEAIRAELKWQARVLPVGHEGGTGLLDGSIKQLEERLAALRVSSHAELHGTKQLMAEATKAGCPPVHLKLHLQMPTQAYVAAKLGLQAALLGCWRGAQANGIFTGTARGNEGSAEQARENEVFAEQARENELSAERALAAESLARLQEELGGVREGCGVLEARVKTQAGLIRMLDYASTLATDLASYHDYTTEENMLRHMMTRTGPRYEALSEAAGYSEAGLGDGECMALRTLWLGTFYAEGCRLSNWLAVSGPPDWRNQFAIAACYTEVGSGASADKVASRLRKMAAEVARLERRTETVVAELLEQCRAAGADEPGAEARQKFMAAVEGREDKTSWLDPRLVAAVRGRSQ